VKARQEVGRQPDFDWNSAGVRASTSKRNAGSGKKKSSGGDVIGNQGFYIDVTAQLSNSGRA
jgi:hypothetical protein